MKRLYLTICLLLAVTLLFGACGRADSDSDGVTLTILGKESDLNKPYLTRLFKLYQDSTGNRLKLLSYEDAEFETKAAQDVAEGRVPDILLHFHNADLNRYDVARDFCTLEDQAWSAGLTDSARAYCTDSAGHLLGLPFWESSVSGCYYNKTLLTQLGLRAAATQTEFDMLCQVLAESGYTPICWPADGCTWMPQFALDPVFADDPATLERLNGGEIGYGDIPAVAEMVRWVQSAAENGWFGDAYGSTGWNDIGPQLASGQAVCTFIWDTWFYTDFPEGTYTMDDFALMPAFMGTADEGTYEGGNLNMMMVCKAGSHVQEALDFLAFCATPESYNAAFDGISTVSCFQGQTTNIQSPMVTEAQASIQAHERVSTAASKIVGYNAEDVMAALNAMLRGETDVDGCVRQMDEARLGEIALQNEVGGETD